MSNYPLAFAELLAGAILLDKGAQAFKGQLSGSGTGSDVAGTGLSTTGPSKSMIGGQAGAEAMLTAAQSVVGGPYSQANHAGAFTQSAAEIKRLGTDCSGFVSYVLGQAGYLSAPQTTVTLPDSPNIEPGAGTYVTIYDRPLPGDEGHVIIDILGNWFEAGGNTADNPSGGIAQITAQGAQSELTGGGGYEALHPVGL